MQVFWEDSILWWRLHFLFLRDMKWNDDVSHLLEQKLFVSKGRPIYKFAWKEIIIPPFFSCRYCLLCWFLWLSCTVINKAFCSAKTFISSVLRLWASVMFILFQFSHLDIKAAHQLKMNATCPDWVSKNFCEEFLEETTSRLELGRVHRMGATERKWSKKQGWSGWKERSWRRREKGSGRAQS